MRQVGGDHDWPIEEDAFSLPAGDLVVLPVLVRVSHFPFESRTKRKFIWESLHRLYITPIYRPGKVRRVSKDNGVVSAQARVAERLSPELQIAPLRPPRVRAP